MAFLYQLTSPSGKRYVGVTTQSVPERWNHHVSSARSGEDWALSRAILKYGPEAFEVRTLAQVEDSEMFELEKRAIAALGTKAPLGYNLTDGGDGTAGLPRIVTNEHKEKLRAAALGKKRGPRSARRYGRRSAHLGSASPFLSRPELRSLRPTKVAAFP